MGCNSSKNVKLVHTQRLQPRKLARRNTKYSECTLQHHNRISPLRHVPSTQCAIEESDSPLLLNSTRTNKHQQESISTSDLITKNNYDNDKSVLEQNNINIHIENETANYSELSNITEHSNREVNAKSHDLKKPDQYQSTISNNCSNSLKKNVNTRRNASSNKNTNYNVNTVNSVEALQEGNAEGCDDDATSSLNSEESVLSLSSLELSGSFRSPVLVLDNGDCRLESAGVMQPSDLMIANSKMAKLRVKTSNRTHSPHSTDAELLLVCVDCGREIDDEDGNCICPLTGKLH